MFWLVESKIQFEQFSNANWKDVFIEIIPSSYLLHPTQNGICALYIKPLVSTKGFIVPLHHSETLNIDMTDINAMLQKFNSIYVRDKKEFLHYLPLKGLFDINQQNPPYIPELLQTHNIFNKRYPNKKNINKIIPIVKHYEYCEEIYNNLKDKINEPINDFYNNKVSMVFNSIERSGIRVNREKFQSHFHDVDGEFIYTQYNYKTLTGRPSNKFKGVNYAALNKENKSRESFIPRNDSFYEFDIGAYHPTLLAKLVGYDFGNEDIHSAFAKMYGVDYKKAKELTFKQLYGGVFDQYKDLEFFKKVQVYTDNLWKEFNEKGWIECPISKHRFVKEKLDEMKPQKLLNYLLQNLETAMNVHILWEIIKLLQNKKTKLVLYTYDSFLFDVSKEEVEILDEIKELFNKHKLQIKTCYGNNYNFK
jgi:hypothetical protein|tara:strand:- start:1066 stop:2325 length:1260 start_codon:yes stop_codon:yes gene_type:complete